MKISTRLYMGFGFTIIITIALGLYSFARLTSLYSSNINTVETVYYPMEFLNEITEDMKDLGYYMLYQVTLGDSQEEMASNMEVIQDRLQNCEEHLKDFVAFLEERNHIDTALYENAIKTLAIISDDLPPLIPVFQEALENNGAGAAVQYFDDNIINLLLAAEAYTADNGSLVKSYADGRIDDMRGSSREVGVIVPVICLGGIVILIAIAHITSRSIIKPINSVVSEAYKVAGGEMGNFQPICSNDEIGELSQCMIEVIGVFQSLANDMEELVNKQVAGYTSFTIDPARYSGNYKKIVEQLNNMAQVYISINKDLLQCIKALSEGNFDASINQYHQEQAIINTVVDLVKDNLKEVNKAINGLVVQAANGRLDSRIDATSLLGGWREMADNLNRLMDAVLGPVNEISTVLTEVSGGNLQSRMSGQYSGSFEDIKVTLNRSLDTTTSYILEISELLREAAEGNFTKSIERDYIGDYGAIKNAFNSIMDMLNHMFQAVLQVSVQVAAGAGHISNAGMSISTGTEEQASSTQNLNSAIELLLEKTRHNAEQAVRARNMADDAKTDAILGNEKMGAMLEAIGGIESVWADISKIINVIEDIAFQINLLALNAAVEAARAGAQGAGFSVVADEVRNLAGKSQKSAFDTKELIESSKLKITEGVNLAGDTAQAFETIVDKSMEVADIVKSIENASVEQIENISNVSLSMNQISNVTQANAAVSQENAASGQELLSQAETLRNMVGKIMLRQASE